MNLPYVDDLKWTALNHNGWFEFLILRNSKGLPAKINGLYDMTNVVQTTMTD